MFSSAFFLVNSQPPSITIGCIASIPSFYPTMPIRNPFAKRQDVQAGLQPPPEDCVRPLSQNGIRPTFEKIDTFGSKASSAMSIRSSQSQEPVEYKMSGMKCAFSRE